MQTLGEKIRELRKKAGLTQEELSYEIDVSRQTICNWEANTTTPNAQCVNNLCKLFNVEATYFFDSDTLKNEEAPSEALPTDKNDICITIKRLKAATITVGVLLACSVTLILIMLAIAVTNDNMDGYSESVSTVSFNTTALFYVFISLTAIIALAFLILLVAYFVLRKHNK